MIGSCVRTPAREPLVILRASFLRLCDGDHCAAVLLNEFVYRTDGQLAAAGDRQWIQATVRQFSAAMMGLYSERKIRQALDLLSERGWLTRKQAENGDNDGGLYALRPNALNKALDGLPPFTEAPGRPLQKGQGAPCKKEEPPLQKGQGVAQTALPYTRARSEKEEEGREKEAAVTTVSSRTGSSTNELRAPAAADPWASAADAVRRFFPALAASAWRKCQRRAEERGYDAQAIESAVPRFGEESLFGASNPVVFVMKLCDRLDAAQASRQERQAAPRSVGKAKVFTGHPCLSCGLDLWWSDGGVGASCFECDPPQWSDELMAQGASLAEAAADRRSSRQDQRRAENREYGRQLDEAAASVGLTPVASSLPSLREAEAAGVNGLIASAGAGP